MERAAWTDERLDDLIEGMRSGFARVDQDIRDQRSEFTAFRSEMRDEFASVRSEINELRRVMLGVGGGIIVTLLAAIVSGGL